MRSTSSRFWIAIFGIYTALATVQIVFLTVQNRKLKNSIALSTVSTNNFDGLKPGDTLTGFNTIDVINNNTRVAYDGSHSLVFITSTRCQWCAKTLPIWKELADAARLRSIQTIGISTDGKGELGSYMKDNALNFEVVNFPNAKIQAAYKAFSTPQTLLVGQGGRVEKVWIGMPSETTKKEILDLLAQIQPTKSAAAAN
jgi:peroxiredoxin